MTLRQALSRVARLERALAPFAAEADEWADTISDKYRPGMSEPRARYVNPGAKATFTVGQCRAAKRLLAGNKR